MKRFIFKQSDAYIISHGGLSLIGQAVKQFTTFSQELDKSVPLRHGIKHSEVMKSYLGLLATGKNDFEAINNIDREFYFMNAMELSSIPGEATLRQRTDKQAEYSLLFIKGAIAN